MMDFTGVKSIIIPEGTVKEILKDGVQLWVTLEEEEPIVVFPLTTLSTMPCTPITYINNSIVFSRPVSVGDKFIIYLNGVAHTATAVDGSAQNVAIQLFSDDGLIELMSVDTTDFSHFVGRLTKVYTETITMEIHYIPS